MGNVIKAAPIGISVEQLLEGVERAILEHELAHNQQQAARALRQDLAVYRAGREGSVPAAWIGIAERVQRERDPEFREYLRLQQKFKEPADFWGDGR